MIRRIASRITPAASILALSPPSMRPAASARLSIGSVTGRMRGRATSWVSRFWVMARSKAAAAGPPPLRLQPRSQHGAAPRPGALCLVRPREGTASAATSASAPCSSRGACPTAMTITATRSRILGSAWQVDGRSSTTLRPTCLAASTSSVTMAATLFWVEASRSTRTIPSRLANDGERVASPGAMTRTRLTTPSTLAWALASSRAAWAATVRPETPRNALINELLRQGMDAFGPGERTPGQQAFRHVANEV